MISGICGVSTCYWGPQRDPINQVVDLGPMDVYEANDWPELGLMPNPRGGWQWREPGLGPAWAPAPGWVGEGQAAPRPEVRKKPSAGKPSASRALAVKPEAQPDEWACGQTSVAMTLRFLTGKSWTGSKVASRYGYGLREALNRETHSLGLSWEDKNFSPKLWKTMEEKLKLGRPVIMGLNGPNFSPSGRGHIVTITGIQGDKVTFVDPAKGKVRTLPKSAFEKAPGHPDGKFVFFAVKSHAAQR